jgi:SAM-dependent methyltransferase
MKANLPQGLMSLFALYQLGAYLQHNPTWHQEESPWKAGRIMEVIERNNLRPATVCDVGCGAGEVLRLLAESLPASTRFFGYDIAPHAIALTRGKAADNISFGLGDGLEDGRQYDLALCLDVVEHVEDYLGFLRRLRQKARYKLLHIPLDLAVQRLLRVSTLLWDMERVGHLHFFTRETALAALHRAGYTIIDCAYIAKRIDLRMGGRKARLLTLPRRLLFRLNGDLASRVFGGWSLSVLAI